MKNLPRIYNLIIEEALKEYNDFEISKPVDVKLLKD